MGYTILNESGERVTTTLEVRDYFRSETECSFLGGYPCSYIMLTTKEYECLEIVAQYLLGDSNELYSETNEYAYIDDQNPENNYNTFGDQFSILEMWDISKLKKEIRKVGV